MTNTTRNYFKNQEKENKDAQLGGGVITADVDIRDLTATDIVSIEGGNTYNVKVTLAGEVVGVEATDLDVRDLTSVTDSVKVEGGNVADVVVSLGNERVNLNDDICESLSGIFTELKVMNYLLNEGLNMKEDLDTLREDFEAELGG